MRIDGVNPIPAVASGQVAEAPGARSTEKAAPVPQDQLEVQPKPKANATSVVVEMQPGNIVIYKFIDEASGQLIQQIPSQQMLNLSKAFESNEKYTKQK